MTNNTLLTYVLAWVPMVFIGTGNGILRQTTHGRFMDELLAHQIPAVMGIALFGLTVLSCYTGHRRAQCTGRHNGVFLGRQSMSMAQQSCLA
jgi:hypothetical protein